MANAHKYQEGPSCLAVLNDIHKKASLSTLLLSFFVKIHIQIFVCMGLQVKDHVLQAGILCTFVMSLRSGCTIHT